MTAIELDSPIGVIGSRTKHRIMRLPEVKLVTGLSRSTIYFRIALGTFPKQVSLGGRAVGWLKTKSRNGYNVKSIQAAKAAALTVR